MLNSPSGITHVKCHPRDGLILRDLSPLDQFEGELLVVEGEGKDGTRRRPGADHEMVYGHGEDVRASAAAGCDGCQSSKQW